MAQQCDPTTMDHISMGHNGMAHIGMAQQHGPTAWLRMEWPTTAWPNTMAQAPLPNTMVPRHCPTLCVVSASMRDACESATCRRNSAAILLTRGSKCVRGCDGAQNVSLTGTLNGKKR